MNLKNVCADLENQPEFSHKDFFDNCLLKSKDLGRKQRHYKKILTTKVKTRNEAILESSLLNTINNMRSEKNNLRAKYYVATGSTHKKHNKKNLKNIKCHIDCQENLAEDIRSYKTKIVNMERTISVVGKEIYDMNLRTIPDAQHLAYVLRSRKKLHLLTNQLEICVRRECGFISSNNELKHDLIIMLNYRTFFNDAYAKLVQKLNNDKKYMSDLIEYVISTFNGCIEIYEKVDYHIKRTAKELENRKSEMQSLVRELAGLRHENLLLQIKTKKRELEDLQPKEYRRREAFRREHRKKINLCNRVVNKILDYTKSENIDQVIKRFKEQESLYYSYFSYDNEISYHITLLHNSVNNLYNEISSLKHKNDETKEDQLNRIENLEKRLKDKRQKNRKLKNKSNSTDKVFNNLLEGIQEIFEAAQCDPAPLNELLGDYTNVNLLSVKEYLKIFEKRVNEILAVVFITERRQSKSELFRVTVNTVEKFCDWVTKLDDIVLTQQCPECAEGEAHNVDDDEIFIHTKEESMKRLKEKVNQPEMQYRLHSISQCRLPRSRAIAANRNL